MDLKLNIRNDSIFFYFSLVNFLGHFLVFLRDLLLVIFLGDFILAIFLGFL